MRVAAVCLVGISSFLLVAGPVRADAGTTDAALAAPQVTVPASAEVPARRVPDSVELEQRLQALDWYAFRSVVEAVPKLRQSVDAYGPFGWEYVRRNYRSYPWRKPIDRLDDTQRVALGELIEQAQVDKAKAGS